MRIYKLEESVRDDITESVRYDFTHNNLEGDWDRFIENAEDRIHEVIDSSLIYTHDTIELWRDLNCPDPEDWSGDSITDGMTWAVYETMLDQINAEDAATDALTELREKILDREIEFTWTGDSDKADQLELCEALEEAEDGPELLAALAEFRSAVEL